MRNKKIMVLFIRKYRMLIDIRGKRGCWNDLLEIMRVISQILFLNLIELFRIYLTTEMIVYAPKNKWLSPG